MPLGEPDKQYQVSLCKTCHHPGSQHVGEAQGYPCSLCDCTAWVEGPRGWWSDTRTEQVLQDRDGEGSSLTATDVVETSEGSSDPTSVPLPATPSFGRPDVRSGDIESNNRGPAVSESGGGSNDRPRWLPERPGGLHTGLGTTRRH